MSSISNATSFPSPLLRLQSQLSSEVKAGTIKSADSDALSSALSSVDSSLSADKAKGSSPASRPDPEAVKAKIGSLIDGQVSAGSLTADQASELKQLFSDAAPKAGVGGVGGGGHVHGVHGGPPPAQASDDSDATTVTGAASTTSAFGTSSTSDTADLLADFLKQVQTSLAEGYSQSGTTTSSKQTSLLFDISA